ncbi:MAG: TrkH family potassium uptake protein [Tannerella sp.]|jgi:trk system potassium uptake protein TrkH|nr:TrkH family potassium uptake protein [Tannerella sp.]
MHINGLYILKTLGLILLFETVFMLMATGVAFIYGGEDEAHLLTSSVIMCVSGLFLVLLGRRADESKAGIREGILTVTLIWLTLSFFGTLPFLIGGYLDNLTDAFLETMSGFTTTGATAFKDVERLPHGILFWRSLMQWQGGIGMIVFTVALLPMFGGNASQLVEAETTGFAFDRFRPRVTQVAKRISSIYLMLTLIFTFLLWIGPMDLFDAINHAMTGISTGGYSTKNASIAYWDSAYTEYVMIVCMIMASMKLTLFFFALQGDFRRLTNDEETRWFFVYYLIFIVITVAWLLIGGFETGIEHSIRKGAFQVISLATTSGFLASDFISWGQFYWLIALFLMVVCGCCGSTSGGLKMGRAMILMKNMLNEFRKQTHPAAILPVRFNGRAVSKDIVHNVHVFLMVYIMLIGFSWLFLLVNGLSFEESIGTAISAISNVGLSLGSLSEGNMSSISDVSKWYVCFIMLVGRLEIFTVLTVLLPGFWKR